MLLTLAENTEGIICYILKAVVSYHIFMSSLEDKEENSENHDKDDFAAPDGEKNEPIESAETPTPSETAEDEERSDANPEEEQSSQEEVEGEAEVCADLWSSASGRFAATLNRFVTQTEPR